MDFKQVKAYFLKRDWYVQAGGAKWLYVSYPWTSCYGLRINGKKISAKYDIHAYIKNDFMDVYLSKKSLEKTAKYYLGKQKSDNKFIQALRKNWHSKNVLPFLQYDKKIRETDLFKLNDKNLGVLFREFSNIYIKLWQEVIFLDAYDYYGEVILNSLLSEEKAGFKFGELDILLTPDESSFLQKERLEIFALAEKIIKGDKNNKAEILKNNYENSIEDNKWLVHELVGLSQKYHWLHNDYATVEYLDREYFFGKLVSLLKDKNSLKIEREMRQNLKDLSSKKEVIVRKYKLSKNFINIANYFSVIGRLRDERKTYNQMGNGIIRILAQEFSRRSGAGIEKIEQLFYWELGGLLQNSKVADNGGKRLRYGALLFITNPRKFYEFNTSEAEKFNNELKKPKNNAEGLKGMPAYMGIVKARVKIIKDKKDFHKMKKGDILIAPNTRPEYVPIMKIASAIVTEEGGITCHAAIISRELKIPCIVGVQGITSVLRDGDIIEADANTGVIKVIK